MARRHRHVFLRHGTNRRASFGHSDYWPLTVVPQASRPKRSKPLMMTIAALFVLSAALAFAFRHGYSRLVDRAPGARAVNGAGSHLP
jgi:hypothetical protein